GRGPPPSAACEVADPPFEGTRAVPRDRTEGDRGWPAPRSPSSNATHSVLQDPVSAMIVRVARLVFGLAVAAALFLAAGELLARVLDVVDRLNGGGQGYDAVAEVRLFETLDLAPEIVVVGTSLNDYDVAPQYSPLGILTRKDLDRRAPSLTDRSEFLTLLRWIGGYLRGQLGSPLMARGPGSPPPVALTEAGRGVAPPVG